MLLCFCSLLFYCTVRQSNVYIYICIMVVAVSQAVSASLAVYPYLCFSNRCWPCPLHRLCTCLCRHPPPPTVQHWYHNELCLRLPWILVPTDNHQIITALELIMATLMSRLGPQLSASARERERETGRTRERKSERSLRSSALHFLFTQTLPARREM